MAVITISRKYASGGRKLGKLLARKIKYDCVDKSNFQIVAKNLYVSERSLESFERGGHVRANYR